MKAIPVQDRFDRHTCYMGDCIVWTGCLDPHGYGQFHWLRAPNRRGTKSHQYAYEAEYGPIPAGLVINHICRNRVCVNPGHMECITRRENVMHPHSESAGKKNREKTHCVRGHPYDAENCVRYGPKRQCRICRNTYHLRVKARGQMS